MEEFIMREENFHEGGRRIFYNYEAFNCFKK